MQPFDYPVEVFCPISETEEYVFFSITESDGENFVIKDNFRGCDHNWSKCPECDACKNDAFEKVK